MTAQMILHHGRITTQDSSKPEVNALAISNGRILAIGTNEEIASLGDASTQQIDLENRRVIPGLNDSHLHVIRAGLFANLELRWDGMPTLAEALRQLKEQAQRTPPPQWVRVIGGWNEFQFAEGRMPTFKELNEAAPDTPVFLLHLYDSAMLNQAAIRALGMDSNTVNPPGGMIAKDQRGIQRGS